MYYFGLRSTATYLRTLEEVRATAEPHHLLSVIGGFAFLHGLSPACRSLTLVDVDPDALEHWHLVRALLLAARSLGDFVTLLSGWQTTGELGDPSHLFVAPVDLEARLASVLSSRQREVYDQTYGALAIDPTRAEGRIGDARVMFLGSDLSLNTYCWQLGTGSLRDEASFAALQATLRRLPQRVLATRLEDLHYGRQPWTRDDRVVFLASNCESPLFTRRDAILRRVLATARVPLRYVSWHRDFRLSATAPSAETAERWLASLADRPAWTLRLSTSGRASPLLRDLRDERSFTATRELLELTEYGRPFLVIDGGSRREITSCLADIAPTFCRILWLADDARSARHLPEDLQPSYWIDPSPRLGAVAFTLRGLRDVERLPTPIQLRE